MSLKIALSILTLSLGVASAAPAEARPDHRGPRGIVVRGDRADTPRAQLHAARRRAAVAEREARLARLEATRAKRELARLRVASHGPRLRARAPRLSARLRALELENRRLRDRLVRAEARVEALRRSRAVAARTSPVPVRPRRW